MNLLKIVLSLMLILPTSSRLFAEEEGLFSTLESKEAFAEEVSGLIGSAWKKWQDSVVINGIEVDGSVGVLRPGDITEPVLTSSSMLANFSRKDKSQDYIKCVRAVVGAVENGMRSWQRGYAHKNIPFPQGSSCVYTMPPSKNVPVVVASGTSQGSKKMEEGSLYNYMLYRVPEDDENTLIVFKAASKSIADNFKKWENTCSIVDITASGGIAPSPAPMGTGPGPVRGAKGKGGKLIGPYIESKDLMLGMAKYCRENS